MISILNMPQTDTQEFIAEILSFLVSVMLKTRASWTFLESIATPGC